MERQGLLVVVRGVTGGLSYLTHLVTGMLILLLCVLHPAHHHIQATFLYGQKIERIKGKRPALFSFLFFSIFFSHFSIFFFFFFFVKFISNNFTLGRFIGSNKVFRSSGQPSLQLEIDIIIIERIKGN